MSGGKWTGRLLPGPEPGQVQGFLVDSWGWRVTIIGTRDPEGGGYRLTGTLGEPPVNLRVPAIDGEKTP